MVDIKQETREAAERVEVIGGAVLLQGDCLDILSFVSLFL